MKKYEVWGYIGNPCEYKMKCKVIEAENSDKAIEKSRIRNVTQVVLIEEVNINNEGKFEQLAHEFAEAIRMLAEKSGNIDNFENYLSYHDVQSIQAGLAMEKLNHIIVDRYFTEEEKAANLKFHETASQEERTKKINDWKIRDKHDIDIIIGKLIDTLGEAKHHFSLIRSEFGHLRIEPYREATEAEISSVLEVLRDINISNRQAIVNYSTKYDDTACKKKAREIYQKNEGKFVTYGDWTGRLKYNEAENHYYFMKKGARSKGYYINERQICTGVKEV